MLTALKGWKKKQCSNQCSDDEGLVYSKTRVKFATPSTSRLFAKKKTALEKKYNHINNKKIYLPGAMKTGLANIL